VNDFEYQAPATVDEAVATCAQRGAGVRVLAGGTDLLVGLREGLLQADVVVDVKRIPELTAIDIGADGSLTFGAAVPCHRLWRDERIVAGWPALTDAAALIGSWQIQGRASVGGNLCNSSPAADSIPALIAAGAVCVVAGPSGRRRVSAADFVTAPGQNVLETGEILVAFELPAPVARSGSRYIRFIPRNEMDIAVAGAGAWVRVDAEGSSIEEARIALAAVAPTPVVAAEAAAFLVGRTISEDVLREAGELAKKAASPITDLRGTAEYRMHLVGVLVRRSLAVAVERANG